MMNQWRCSVGDVPSGWSTTLYREYDGISVSLGAGRDRGDDSPRNVVSISVKHPPLYVVAGGMVAVTLAGKKDDPSELKEAVVRAALNHFASVPEEFALFVDAVYAGGKREGEESVRAAIRKALGVHP